jgi:hypothetical protein
MPIPVECGSCHKKFKAGDKLAGRKAKCSQCGGVITIPKPEAPPQPPASVGDLLDEAEIPIRVEPQPAQENCPSCSAPLATGAVLCVQCGYDLRSGTKHQTQLAPGSDPVEDILIGPVKIDDDEEESGSQLPQGLAFVRGCAISFGCAMAGMIIFVLVGHYFSGLALGLVALVVGGLAGMGMAFGYGHDDVITGGTAAVITFIAIIMGHVIIFLTYAGAADVATDIDDESYAVEEAWDEDYADAEMSEEDLAALEAMAESEMVEPQLSPAEIAALEREQEEFESEMEREVAAGIVVLLLAWFWDIVALIFACGLAYQVATEWHP